MPILTRQNSLVESFFFRRLTVIFELASNFISAHEDVDILELLHEGPVAYQLALEKNRQLQDARGTLAQQLPVFPELARSLKTRVSHVVPVFLLSCQVVDSCCGGDVATVGT